MEIKTSQVIELTQSDIIHIIVSELQKRDILKNNVPTKNIYIREENGEIKCTINDI